MARKDKSKKVEEEIEKIEDAISTDESTEKVVEEVVAEEVPRFVPDRNLSSFRQKKMIAAWERETGLKF